MLLTTNMLRAQLDDYANPDTRIARMVRAGDLFPVRRGLYETDRLCPGESLAAVLYGPSYLSFEYALARYGLIPEQVTVYTSATFRKNRAKRFENAFGVYTYRDVPPSAFPYGIALVQDRERQWSIACPEKALCDQLYIAEPVGRYGDLEGLLFDGMRLDEQRFEHLNMTELAFLASRYGKKNLRFLERYARERTS